jgi:hypothetical protein
MRKAADLADIYVLFLLSSLILGPKLGNLGRFIGKIRKFTNLCSEILNSSFGKIGKSRKYY